MRYTLRKPCGECPFLKKMERGFTLERLEEFASGEFPCHKACDTDEEGDFVARSDKTPHCAGALIFNEKRNTPHQMMRISERLGLYDRTKLDMEVELAWEGKS